MADREELFQFVQHFGTTTGGAWSTGDFNGDGATNLADLALMQQNYSPSASSSAVPEPASCLLALTGLALIAVRARRSA